MAGAQKEKGKGQMERRLSLISGIALIVGTMIGILEQLCCREVHYKICFHFDILAAIVIFQGLEFLYRQRDFWKEPVLFTFPWLYGVYVA